MKNVVFDLFTNQVKGIDREPLPAESSIDLPYRISLSKTVEEKTGNLIQKVNDQGEPLFKDDVAVDEITGEETFTEVTTPMKVTANETITNTYKVVVGETTEEQTNEFGEVITVTVPVYEEITTTSEVPIEWLDLEPVMIAEAVSRTYTLEQNPFLFTRDEVLAAKEQSIIDAENAPPSDMEVVKGTIDFIIMNLD